MMQYLFITAHVKNTVEVVEQQTLPKSTT